MLCAVAASMLTVPGQQVERKLAFVNDSYGTGPVASAVEVDIKKRQIEFAARKVSSLPSLSLFIFLLSLSLSMSHFYSPCLPGLPAYLWLFQRQAIKQTQMEAIKHIK